MAVVALPVLILAVGAGLSIGLGTYETTMRPGALAPLDNIHSYMYTNSFPPINGTIWCHDGHGLSIGQWEFIWANSYWALYFIHGFLFFYCFL